MHDVSTHNPAHRIAGLTLRQAALIAGFALLIMGGTPVAEFYILPNLIVSGDIAATVENILANRGLYVTALLIYTNTFIGDIVVTWALYALLAPVNRALSMLTAWFRLVYTVIAFVGLMKLVSIYRLLTDSGYADAFGTEQLHAQVQVLYLSFRYEWSFGLVLFGIHLGLLGYLAYRASYIPKTIGVLLLVAGLGYFVYGLGPYIAPGADLGWLFVTFFGELVFMFWLLIRGWKIQEPA